MQQRFIKKLLIVLLFSSSTVYAAPNTVAKRNDNAATTFQNNNNQDAPISVDDKGRLFIAPTPIRIITDGTPIPVSIQTPVGVNFLGTPQPVTITTPVGVNFLGTPQPVTFAGTPQPVTITTPVGVNFLGTPQPVNFAGTPQPVNINVALQTPIPMVFTTPVGVNFLGTPQPISVAEVNQPFSAPKVNNTTGFTGMYDRLSACTYIINDTAETGSTASVINATSHQARPGDVIYMINTAATNNLRSWSVVDTTATNTITLKFALPTAPANGNSFLICRHVPLSATSVTSSGQMPGLYTALDSRIGGNDDNTFLRRSGDTWGITDTGSVPMYSARQSDSNDNYAVIGGNNQGYTQGQTDPSGRIAVNIDCQVPGGYRSLCATDSGATTWTNIVPAGECEGKRITVRNIACNTVDDTNGTDLQFGFDSTMVWPGNIAPRTVSDGYNSGLLIPALRAPYEGAAFDFVQNNATGIICCANFCCDGGSH